MSKFMVRAALATFLLACSTRYASGYTLTLPSPQLPIGDGCSVYPNGGQTQLKVDLIGMTTMADIIPAETVNVRVTYVRFLRTTTGWTTPQVLYQSNWWQGIVQRGTYSVLGWTEYKNGVPTGRSTLTFQPGWAIQVALPYEDIVYKAFVEVVYDNPPSLNLWNDSFTFWTPGCYYPIAGDRMAKFVR